MPLSSVFSCLLVILLHFYTFGCSTVIDSTKLDKLAIMLSGICLVHCLVVPIVMTLLPILSISALVDDVLFHQLVLWVVLPISALALIIGCRKHRKPLIIASGVIGLSILVVVAFLGHSVLGETYEKVATSVGGLVLAFSHYLNYRECQAITCTSSNCSSDHHH